MNTIDVHSHLLPKIYLEALREVGEKDLDGFPIPEWHLDSHLSMMEAQDIQACILSLSAPGLRFWKGKARIDLARSINEELSAILKAYPMRFGAFAVLPLPDVEASLEEINYALDYLKLDGVGLFSNYDGIYLGNPLFLQVLEALNSRHAVAFVHPTAPLGQEHLNLTYPTPMLEYPFDSTRMVVSLIDADVLERQPNIRFIVPHGGGTLPYLWPRIGSVMAGKKGQNYTTFLDSLRKQLQSLFYDLTASTHPAALRAIKESQPISQLMMGFDFPFMPSPTIKPTKKFLSESNLFSLEECQFIDSENACKLFPRLGSGELHTISSGSH